MTLFPEAFEVNNFVVFGLLLLVGLVAGGLAHRTNYLPSITGFMIVGFIIGPGGTGIISEVILKNSWFFVDIALAIILFDLGRQLNVKQILQDRGFLLSSLAEMGASFVLVALGLMAFGIPPLAAFIVAAIGVSGSPAIVIMVVREFKAKGPITTNTLNFLAMNNMGAFLLFAALLPVIFISQDGSWQDIVLSPFYLVLVSVAVAAFCAGVSILLLWIVGDQVDVEFAIVIGIIMLSIGLSKTFGGSELLTAMLFGLMVANHPKLQSMKETELGLGAEAFFIILFVIAGAKLNFHGVLYAAPVAALFVVLRAAGKWGGLFALKKQNGFTPTQRVCLTMLLMPMAGLAIGLSQTTYVLDEEVGLQILPIIFSVVAILETIGPVLSEWALRKSGEIGKDPIRH